MGLSYVCETRGSDCLVARNDGVERLETMRSRALVRNQTTDEANLPPELPWPDGELGIPDPLSVSSVCARENLGFLLVGGNKMKYSLPDPVTTYPCFVVFPVDEEDEFTCGGEVLCASKEMAWEVCRILNERLGKDEEAAAKDFGEDVQCFTSRPVYLQTLDKVHTSVEEAVDEMVKLHIPYSESGV